VRSEFSNTSIPNGDVLFEYPSELLLDSANNRLLVADNVKDAVYAVDISSGARTLLWNYDVDGTENDIGYISDMKMDLASNRVLALDYDSNKIVGINLENGDRVTVGGDGTSDVLTNPVGIVTQAGKGYVLVIAEVQKFIVAMDRETGEQVIFSK